MELAQHFNDSAVALINHRKYASDITDGEVLLKHAAASIQCDSGALDCSGRLDVEPTPEAVVTNHGLQLYPHFFRFTAACSPPCQQVENPLNSRRQSGPGKLLFDVGFRPMGRESGDEGKLIALAVCYYNQALLHQLRYFLKQGTDEELRKAARLYQITHDLLLGNQLSWTPDARYPRAPASVIFLATCTNMTCLAFSLSDIRGVEFWADKLRQWLPFFKWHMNSSPHCKDEHEANCNNNNKTCPERHLFRLAHLLPALDIPTAAGAA